MWTGCLGYHFHLVSPRLHKGLDESSRCHTAALAFNPSLRAHLLNLRLLLCLAFTPFASFAAPFLRWLVLRQRLVCMTMWSLRLLKPPSMRKWQSASRSDQDSGHEGYGDQHLPTVETKCWDSNLKT
jgi:hypothetical protein